MIHKLIVIFLMLLISTCSTGYAESGSSLFDNGIAEFQKGRYQDAVFWFTKLIEKEPFNAKAYKNRGVARLSLQKYDMAIEDLNSALNPDLQMEDITGNLGPAWHYKEEYKKAMDDFNSALNLDPDLEGIHSNIGVAWYYAREYQKAISEYDKELKKHPENYSAFFNRALSWVELKEYQKALNDLESVLTIKPDEYWAIAYKGDVYSELNNSAAARESYLAAMALNTGNKYAKERLLALNKGSSRVAAPVETLPPGTLGGQSGETGTAISTPESESASIKRAETVAATMGETPTEKVKVTQSSPEKKSVKASTMAHHTEKRMADMPNRTSVPPSADATVQQPPLTQEKEGAPPTEEKEGVSPKFTIQLGAFLDSANAEEVINSLREKGYVPRVINLQDKKNRQWTLVRTGTFRTAKPAKQALKKIKKELNVDAVIRPIGKF